MIALLSSVITHTHNTSLALAAIVVSIVAAITGLALMNNIRTLPESRRKAVIVMAAFLIGGGIWSMHFLAMLALRFSVPIHYDLLQTLGSGLIAVLVVGFALLLLHFRTRTHSVLNTAGVCLGVGIVSMHVVGMLGMRGVIPSFNVAALSGAFFLALIMGVATIRVSYGSRSRQNIVKGGVLFGLSVVVVHYTAMIGTHFSVDPEYQELTIALNQGALAIAVTVTAFVICGTFLLAASTFVPSPTSDTAAAGEGAVPQYTDRANLQPAGERIEPEFSKATNGSIVSEVKTVAHNSPDIPATQSQISNPPDSTSLHLNPTDESAQLPTTDNSANPLDPHIPVKIPYEQQKQILFIDSNQVGAIRADGRYTQLYTRDGVKFCPWSITQAEKRLQNARFYRSHRSYLINLTAVAGFKKNRDSGICQFEGFTQLSNVPVSRARVGNLVAELGL